jgi:hypothetical protein
MSIANTLDRDCPVSKANALGNGGLAHQHRAAKSRRPEATWLRQAPAKLLWVS